MTLERGRKERSVGNRNTTARSACNRTGLPLVIALLLFTGCAHAPPQPAKTFPRFASRKGTFERLKLLCDVEVIQYAEANKVSRILLDETSALGLDAEIRLKQALTAEGYPVDGSAVSTGSRHDRWTKWPTDTTVVPARDENGVFSTPFIRDSTLFRNAAILSEWKTLLDRLLGLDFQPPHTFYQPRPGDPPVFLPHAVTICDSLGGSMLAVVRLDFHAWEMIRGHPLGPTPPLSLSEKLLGGRLFKSGSSVSLTMLDGKTGEILWHDGMEENGSYDRKRIEQMIATIVENLP